MAATLRSTNRLSQDTLKCSNALRDYGNAEGDDLEDILSKLSFLLDQLSKAQAAHAEHEATVRLHFKTLRTREENFIALKKSKDSLQNRIESAERQFAKTSAEHKDRPAREAKLHELKSEMVGMEQSVLNEEARLGDFKRDAVKEALSLKLGAMLELAEKQTIVAEMGKLLVVELPTHTKTIPGRARTNYTGGFLMCFSSENQHDTVPIGYSNTEEVMQEAQRCLSSVIFNPNPAPATPTTPTQRFQSFQRSSSGSVQPLTLPAETSYDTQQSLAADMSHSNSLTGPAQDTAVYQGEKSPIESNQQSQMSLPFTNYTNATDNRSSLAYMDETPDSEPAPVQVSQSVIGRRSTPSSGNRTALGDPVGLAPSTLR